MLLTLALFTVIAFAMLIVERELESYLPVSLRGPIRYLLGGTLLFFFVLRMRSRSRQGSMEQDENEDSPKEPAAEPDFVDTDALESMRRRIRDRKSKRGGSQGNDEKERI
jgi:flagellar biosynthesis/type III secretory pathway M-ring protein FliF/YscJ